MFSMKQLVVTLVLLFAASHALGAPATQMPEPILRFVALGDAEPKPEARFPGLAAAVDDVNLLAKQKQLDFAIGVGDIAHKGTLVQYEAASHELERLALAFYPIMGNEEHGSSVARFLAFAQRWNPELADLEIPSYVLEFEHIALVLASPDHGRDFADEGIAWVTEQLQALAPKPVLLVVHGAQTGVYTENPDKGITHPDFAQVIRQPNLAAVISGDLHMDMPRVEHSKQIGNIHYLHIPALERTKIPDASHHTPMFRTFTLYADGTLDVETFIADGSLQPVAAFDYRFNIQNKATTD